VPVDPHGGGLVDGLHDELVDVDVGRARNREEHAVGDVLRLKRVDVLVDLLRPFLIASEADLGEVRLDEAGVDRRQVDRPAEQILPQRVRETAHGELRGDVDSGVLVRLTAGDGADVDDVAAVADVRQAEPGQAEHPEHVRLDHRRLVLVGRFPERLAAQAEPRIVDEDVDSAEVGHGALDETLGARLVRDVEVERVEAVPVREQLGAAGADGNTRASLGKRMRSGRPDPARGAGDDSRLVLE
jgi:hypothetical protein